MNQQEAAQNSRINIEQINNMNQAEAEAAFDPFGDDFEGSIDHELIEPKSKK